MPELITLDEFVQKYQGKYLEVAGSAGAKNQCVDLANGYIRDVLGLPIVEWTNASDFSSKLIPLGWKWVENTSYAIPIKGALMIWKHTVAGHISVFIEGDINSFVSFDQNYPTGTACHLQKHNYLSPKVAGWLIPPNLPATKPERKSMTHEQFYNKFLEAFRKHKDTIDWGDDKHKFESQGLSDESMIGRMLDQVARDKTSKEAKIKELESKPTPVAIEAVEFTRVTTVAGMKGEINGWKIKKGDVTANYKLVE